MTLQNKKDIYEFDELINKLENIKCGIDDKLNIPKALYCLSMEIKSIKQRFSEEEKDLLS